LKIKAYIEGVVSELLEKVTWPTWSELQNSSLVVLVASVIVALSVWVMDFTFGIQGSLEDETVIWRGLIGFIYYFLG
jgi:preprotein translocase subunit SecE